MNKIRKRLTYANVMSSIAVFLVLGGATAFAASHLGKNSVGTKQLKRNSVTAAKLRKNAVTTAKLKNAAVTGAKVNLSTLGTVPSATNATNVGSVKTFSAGANNHELVSLVKTANFELMGFCDPNEELVAPGLPGIRKGTVMVIFNRSSTVAFADSSDDENYRMGLNEAIGFNYQDNGDGGLAMATDGHFLAVPAWGNEVADTSFVNVPNPGSNYPFSTTCHFAGAALVG